MSSSRINPSSLMVCPAPVRVLVENLLLITSLPSLQRNKKLARCFLVSKKWNLSWKVFPTNIAFGHAKSDHSLNSSKFSRYTEMQYNQKGKLIGCKTVEYALAKNHLISLVDRNFHIFYLLLAGATQEEKAFWRLSDPSSFHYLSKSSLSPVFYI